MLSNSAARLRFQPVSCNARLIAFISVWARNPRSVTFGGAGASEPAAAIGGPGCVIAEVSVFFSTS